MNTNTIFNLAPCTSHPATRAPHLAPCTLHRVPRTLHLVPRTPQLAPFIICLLLALSPAPSALSQIPQGFNYQAIAKDGSGNPIAGQTLPVRISIQSDSLGGTVFWVELHSTVTTNSSGLLTLVVGKGAKQSGTAASFSAIDWSVTPKYIMTEVDYGGWKTLGSSKMWSVPYAMVSTTSDAWTTSGSDIYRSAGNVGINTSSPVALLDVQTSPGYHFGSFSNTPGASSIGAFNNDFSAWQPLSINPGGPVWFLGPTVGIGTNNPDKLLTVYSNVTNTQIAKFSDNARYIGLGRDEVGSYDLAGNRAALYLNGGALSITSEGKVGIGTTTPTSRLHVQGGEGRFGYNSGNSSLSFTTGFGNSFMFKPLDHALQIQTDHTGNPVVLYLDKSGPIGIGNTNPGYLLDISGRIRIRTGGGSAGIWLNNAGNTAERSFIGMYDDDRVGFFGAGSGWGMVMNVNNGAVGFGTASPVSTLHVAGDAIVEGRLAGQYFTGSGTVLLVGNDSKLEDVNIGNTMGVYGMQDVNQGHIKLGATGPIISGYNGNVGIGNTAPASKLSVQVPTDAWADEVPLFEVKNKKGIPVLAVYNYGVRILVDQSDSKALKGGFAVSGYDYTKAGGTTPLMIVNPDSIRFNISNSATKGYKGGFAVGSFADTKGTIDEDFLYITPQNSSSGKYTTRLGYNSGINSVGPHNTFIGVEAGKGVAEGNGAASNIFIGEGSGMNNDGGYTTMNIILPGGGTKTVYNSFGGENVAIGNYTGIGLYGSFTSQSDGKRNLLLGHYAGYNLTTGSTNVIVGNSAGYNLVSGDGNVFIGNSAGSQETGSKKLYIANTNTTNPLIFGDFDYGYIKINGWMGVGAEPGTPFAIAGLTGTTSGQSLRIFENNVYYYSSSRKTKTDIIPFYDDFYKILNAQPVSFKDRVSGERNIGFIAEDFDALGLNELVVYKDGIPLSLNYELISIYNLEIIKDQQTELNHQKELIDSQNQKIARLEKLVEQLLESR